MFCEVHIIVELLNHKFITLIVPLWPKLRYDSAMYISVIVEIQMLLRKSQYCDNGMIFQNNCCMEEFCINHKFIAKVKVW